MSKGIVIDVGFKGDIKEFVNNIQNEFEKIDFSKSIKASKEFELQEKEIRNKLKELNDAIEKTIGKDVAKTPAEQFQNLNNAVKELSSSMLTILKNMDNGIDYSKQIAGVEKSIRSFTEDCESASEAIKDLGNIQENLTFSNPEEKLGKQKELINKYKELKSIIEKLNKIDNGGSFIDRSIVKKETALEKIREIYDKIQEFDINEIPAPGEDWSSNKSAETYAYHIIQLQKYLNTYRKIVKDNQRDLSEEIDGIKISDLIEYPYEAEDFSSVKKNILKQLVEIEGLYKETFGTNIEEIIQKSSNNNDQIHVAMTIDKKAKDDLYGQAITVIKSISERLKDSPLQVAVDLYSNNSARKTQKKLNELYEEIYNGENNVSSLDDSTKIKLEELISKEKSRIDDQLAFTVNVNTQKAQSALNEFKKDFKDTIHQLNEEVTRLSPKIELTDENKQEFQAELDKASNQFIVKIKIDDTNVDTSTGKKKRGKKVGDITKDEIGLIELLSEKLDEVIKKVNDKTEAFRVEQERVEEYISTEIKSIEEFEKVISNIKDNINSINNLIINFPEFKIKIDKNSIDEFVNQFDNEKFEKIKEASDSLSFHMSETDKAQILIDLQSIENKMSEIFDDGHVNSWAKNFIENIETIHSELSSIFSPLSQKSKLLDQIYQWNYSDIMMKKNGRTLFERSMAGDSNGNVYGAGTYGDEYETKYPNEIYKDLKSKGIDVYVVAHSHSGENIPAMSSPFTFSDSNGHKRISQSDDLSSNYNRKDVPIELTIGLKSIESFRSKDFFDSNSGIDFSSEEIRNALAIAYDNVIEDLKSNKLAPRFFEGFVKKFGNTNNFMNAIFGDSQFKDLEKYFDKDTLVEAFFKNLQSGTSYGSSMTQALKDSFDFSKYGKLKDKNKIFKLFDNFGNGQIKNAQEILKKAFNIEDFNFNASSPWGGNDFAQYILGEYIVPESLRRGLKGTSYKDNFSQFRNLYTIQEYMDNNPDRLPSSTMDGIFGEEKNLNELYTTIKNIADALFSIKESSKNIKIEFNETSIDSLIKKIDELISKISNDVSATSKITSTLIDEEIDKTKNKIIDIDRKIAELKSKSTVSNSKNKFGSDYSNEVFEHYGYNNFDAKKFENVTNSKVHPSKPEGGYWASGENDEYTWKNFSENNKDIYGDVEPTIKTTFKFLEDAKILEIKTIKDLEALPKTKDSASWASSSSLISMLKPIGENIDWETVAKEYDAIRINLENKEDYNKKEFSTFDVDSVVVTNPDAIQILSNEKINNGNRRIGFSALSKEENKDGIQQDLHINQSNSEEAQAELNTGKEEINVLLEEKRLLEEKLELLEEQKRMSTSVDNLGNNNSSETTRKNKSESIDKEPKSLELLKSTLTEIVDLINKKNELLKNEKEIVTDGVPKEKQAFKELSDIIFNINKSLSEYKNSKLLSDINSLFNNTKNNKKIENLLSCLNSIKDSVSNFNFDSSSLQQLNNILSKTEELKSLENIFKNSNKSSTKIIDNQIKENGKNNSRENITNYWDQIEDSINLKLPVGSTVISKEMKATQDGLVRIVSLVKEADGEVRKYTLTSTNGEDTQIEKIESGTDALRKQTEQLKKMSGYKTLLQKYIEDNNLSESSIPMEFEKGSELFNSLITLMESFGIESQNVAKIVRQMNGELESFQITMENGDFNIIGVSSNDILYQKQDIMNNIELIDKIKKASSSAASQLNTAFNGSDVSVVQFIQSLETIKSLIEKINKSPLELTSDQIDVIDKSVSGIFNTAKNRIEKKVRPDSTDNIINLSNDAEGLLPQIQNELENGNVDTQKIEELIKLGRDLYSIYSNSENKNGDPTKLLRNIYDEINKNSAAPKKLKNELYELANQIQYLGESITNDQVKQFGKDFTEIQEQIQKTGKIGKNLFSMFKSGFKQDIVNTLLRYTSLWAWIGYIRQGIQYVTQMDTALTKMSYTMNVSDETLKNMSSDMIEMADNLKTSLSNMESIYQIYANMKTSQEELTELAEPTAILSNLASIDSSTAADYIQAVINQFDMAAEDANHIADVYDYVSANIAVDYSKGIAGIASAVENVGNVANSAGLSFEQLSSIIATTMEQTRQDGASIGNALKTIIVRLSKASSMSDEIDSDTLSNASKALHAIGIEVYTSSGEFREFDVIMGELSKKWDSLSDAQRKNISYQIAATRQTAVLESILENYSDSMELAKDATETEGNALANQEKYIDSINGKIQSIKTNVEEMWLNIINSNGFKIILDFIESITEALDKFTDTFGAAGSAIALLGIINGAKFALNVDKTKNEEQRSLIKEIISPFFTKIKKIINKSTDDIKLTSDTVNDAASKVGNVIENLSKSVEGSTVASNATSAASDVISDVAKTATNVGGNVATAEAVKNAANVGAIAGKEVVESGALTETVGGIVESESIATAIPSIEVTGMEIVESEELAAGIFANGEVLGGAVSGAAETATATATAGEVTKDIAAGAAASGPYGLIIAAAVAALIAAVYGTVKAVNNHIDTVNKLEEIGNDFNSQIEDLENASNVVSEYGEEFEKLSAGVSKTGKNINLTDDDYEEYLSISNKIADVLPELVVGYDDEGNAILRNASSIEELNAALENHVEDLKLTQAEINKLNKSISTNLNGDPSGISDGEDFWAKAFNTFLVPYQLFNSTTYGYSADELSNYFSVDQVENALNNVISKSGSDVEEYITNLQSKVGHPYAQYMGDMLEKILTESGLDYNSSDDAINYAFSKYLEDYEKSVQENVDNVKTILYSDLYNELSKGTNESKKLESLIESLTYDMIKDVDVDSTEGRLELENILVNSITDNGELLFNVETELENYLNNDETKEEAATAIYSWLLELQTYFEDNGITIDLSSLITFTGAGDLFTDDGKVDNATNAVSTMFENAINKTEKVKRNEGKYYNYGTSFGDEDVNDFISQFAEANGYATIDEDGNLVFGSSSNYMNLKSALKDIGLDIYGSKGNGLSSPKNFTISTDDLLVAKNNQFGYETNYDEVQKWIDNNFSEYTEKGLSSEEQSAMQLEKQLVQNMASAITDDDMLNYFKDFISSNGNALFSSLITESGLSGQEAAQEWWNSWTEYYNSQAETEDAELSLKDFLSSTSGLNIENFFDGAVSSDTETWSESFSSAEDTINDLTEYYRKLINNEPLSTEDKEALARTIGEPINTMDDESIKETINSAMTNLRTSISDAVTKYFEENPGLTDEAKDSILKSVSNLGVIGLSGEYKIEKITLTGDALSDMETQMSEGFDLLDTIYADIQDGGYFDWSNLINNETFNETFSAFTEEYDAFQESVRNNPADTEANTKAFNDLVTAWINGSGILTEITEENKDYVKSYFEQNGVLNAQAVVNSALAWSSDEAKEALEGLTEENKDTTIAALEAMGALGAETVVEDKLAAQAIATSNNMEDYADASEDELQALYSKISGEEEYQTATSNVQSQLFSLTAQETIFANSNLTLSGKIRSLESLAKAYGAVTTEIVELKKYEKMFNNYKDAEEYADAMMSTMYTYGMTDKDKEKQREHYISYYNSIEASLEEKVQEIVKNATTSIGEVEISYTGGEQSQSARDSAEEYDWIETYLSRLEHTIDHLDHVASATYKSWTTREKATDKEISSYKKDMNAQNKAATEYKKKADSVTGLTDAEKKKIREGVLNGNLSSEFTKESNEDKQEAIEKYKEYYENYLSAKEGYDSAEESYYSAIMTKFDNITTQYDALTASIDHNINMIEGSISMIEESGHIVDSKYYSKEISKEQERIEYLQDERAELVSQLSSLEKGTEAWEEQEQKIKQIDEDIQSANKNILTYSNSIRQIHWDLFDLGVDQVNAINDELSFMNELLDDGTEHSLFDDYGNWKDTANASAYIDTEQYNLHNRLAEQYKTELENLDAQYADDANNTNYLSQRQELVASYQSEVTAAKEAKSAIKDLYSQGYEKLTSKISELISDYEDLIDKEKDAYDYEKSVEDKTKTITSLTKRLQAYSGDTSEENQATISQLKDELEDAQDDLYETEWDHMISEQKDMLSDFQDDLQDYVDERLDNIDTLFEEANQIATEEKDSVNKCLSAILQAYGYDESYYNASTGTYSSGGNTTDQTISGSILETVNNIFSTLSNYTATTSSGNTVVKSDGTTVSSSTTQGNNSLEKGDLVTLTKGAKVYNSKGKEVSWDADKQYIVSNTKSKGSYPIQLKNPTTGKVLGYTKKKNLNGYAVGTKSADDELAWTQENGEEIIFRKSDGAMLTPLNNGDMVFTHDQTEALWNMSKGAMNTGSFTVPAISANSTGSTSMTIGNIVVQANDPETFATQLGDALKNNTKIQKMIQANTIDLVAGKNSLSVRKY